MPIDYKKLLEEMPFKFKPQAVKYGKATMVSYIDARDVQDKLDEVVGPENWQSEYRPIDGNLYCGIGIQTEKDRWVWKWDCGTESNMEKEKGQASDAFKRAAVQWGVGRFLYRQGVIELKTADYKGKEKPATDDGKILWNNDQITKYIRDHKIGNKVAPSSSKGSSSKKDRYESSGGKPNYSKNAYSPETIARVNALDKENLKGKECLKHFLPKFCDKKEKNYKSIVDLNDDVKLGELLDFIEGQSPAGI